MHLGQTKLPICAHRPLEIFVYTHSHLKHLVKNIVSVLTFGGNHNGKLELRANKALN